MMDMETVSTRGAPDRRRQCHSRYARTVYSVFSGIFFTIAGLGAASAHRTAGRVVALALAMFFLYTLVRALRTGVTFSTGPVRLTYHGLLTTRTWTAEQVTAIEVQATYGVGCPTVVLPNEQVRLRGLTGSRAFSQDPQAQFLAMASQHNFKTPLAPA